MMEANRNVPRKPIKKVRHGKYPKHEFFCPNCLHYLYRKRKPCANCGQEVKWK